MSNENNVYIIRFTKPWRNYTAGDVAGFGEKDAKVILEGVIEEIRTPAGPKKLKHGPWGKQVRKTTRATLQKEQQEAANKERVATLQEENNKMLEKIEANEAEIAELTGKKPKAQPKKSDDKKEPEPSKEPAKEPSKDSEPDKNTKEK